MGILWTRSSDGHTRSKGETKKFIQTNKNFSLKKFSLSHKLKLSNPYISLQSDGDISNFWSIRIHSLKYLSCIRTWAAKILGLENIGLDKDLVLPTKRNVSWHKSKSKFISIVYL